MKKFTKIIALVMVCMLAVAVLVACAPTQKDADAINQAAKDKDPWTYEKCVKKFGDPTINVAGSVGSLGVSGIVTWVSGCKTAEDIQKKLDNGEKLSALVVTFLNGKATAAEFVPEYNGK